MSTLLDFVGGEFDARNSVIRNVLGLAMGSPPSPEPVPETPTPAPIPEVPPPEPSTVPPPDHSPEPNPASEPRAIK
jgi:outer membrane biosynthesis protein TonB